MSDHVDVLVVGAGISGIGAGHHLRERCPDRSFVILESQADFGGTWRTHTYPGARSDSDLHTFGYGFKPWRGKPIATAQEILDYLGEVIDEDDLDRRIRYSHTIDTATWSSDERQWTIRGHRTGRGTDGVAADADGVVGDASGDASGDDAGGSADGGGEPFEYTANFLYMCQGYYRHSRGYQPTWPGMDRFGGRIVHPQHWPDDLEYEGKRVVVIGSGATAATLIPAMAPDVGHITMLQRSPTYFRAGRNASELADQLREVDTPEEWVHEIVRRRMILDSSQFTDLCFRDPEAAKEMLFENLRAHLDEDHQDIIDPHFTPRYLPWRERIAFVPDGDLFQAINSGKASVVTDQIATFTETGIELESGDLLEADIVVTATGFDLSVLGDIAFTIDGEPLDFHETVTYHGTMFTGVPNMAWVFGYFRASWTLRADLIAEFVCRLLNHMRDRGAEAVVPALRPEDEPMERRPWIDPENFNPGYIRRGLHLLPRQGDHDPWRHGQDYWTEKDILPTWDLDDGALVYS